MLEEVIKAIIFLILLGLGGYFFVLFQRRGWFFLPKVGHKNLNSDALHITGRMSVGGRHYIAIVQCNDQKFLVGVSPSSITSLGKLESVCHQKIQEEKNQTCTQQKRPKLFREKVNR